ncbi:MAG: hypothetical protein ACFFDJ_02745, partial [Candidatus Odinarchaeota archaeon]
ATFVMALSPTHYWDKIAFKARSFRIPTEVFRFPRASKTSHSTRFYYDIRLLSKRLYDHEGRSIIKSIGE